MISHNFSGLMPVLKLAAILAPASTYKNKLKLINSGLVKFPTNALRRILSSILLVILCCSTSACISTIIGTTVDVAIEAAKVPFKVGGAIIDVAVPDSDDEDKDDD